MQLYFQGLMIGLAYVAPIGMQNIFVINSALTQPRRRAALTALIIIFFDVGLAFFCYFGLGAIVERLPWLQMAVMSIGGLVVMWIGLGLLRDKPSMDHSADMDIPLPKVAWKSFAVTWLNPQALIDGAMLFGGFRAGHPGLGGVQLVLGSATASVLWFSGVTLAVSLFSARFSERVLRLINLICGSILMLYGGRLAFRFLQNLL